MSALNASIAGLSVTRAAAIKQHESHFDNFKSIKQMTTCRQAELRLVEKKEAAAEKAKAVAKKTKKFDKKLAKLTEKLAKASENLQKMDAAFKAAVDIQDAEIVEKSVVDEAAVAAPAQETITSSQFEKLFAAIMAQAALATGAEASAEEAAAFRKAGLEKMAALNIVVVEDEKKAQPSTVTEVEGDTIRTTTTVNVEAGEEPKSDFGIPVPEEAHGAIAEALRKANAPKGNRNKGNNAKGSGN